MTEIRKPAVAGQFYDAKKENLVETIENCFKDKRGPGKIPKIKEGKKEIKGVVVPHAGLIFSGAIAAHSYATVAQSGFADVFIILGPNHTGLGSGVAMMKKGFWQTPLGKIKINEKLAEKIHTGIIDEDNSAHRREHSIEVQIPFLQYLAQKKDITFVPITMAMQDKNTNKEVGEIIAKAIKTSEEKIIIIASSDFSHVGFNYMTMPPAGTNVDEYAETQDKKAIEEILNLNPKRLVETVEKENISMCGYGPVSAMLHASKKLSAEKAELLKYGSSYEVHPGSSCVGYAAISIY